MRKMEVNCPENHPQAAHRKSTAFPQKNVNKWGGRQIHVLCQPNAIAD